jgi:hypothetical protein
MELKVNEVQLPEVIKFNYDELKAELTEKVKKYETLVYTEEQIKEAKADKASLNKLKKALNDERIRREKEYMQPFNEFKTKINEIIGIIDKPITLIDTQIKEADEKRKNDKRVEIGAYYETTGHPDWLTLPRLFDERWLNSTYSMKQIQTDIDAWLRRIDEELQTLASLPDFSYEATEEYKRTLDINKAIAEGKRLADIQKRKEQAQAEAEAEKKAASVDAAEFMTPPEPEPKLQAEEKSDGMWLKFEAFLTVPQALKLKDFFESNHIEFKPI